MSQTPLQKKCGRCGIVQSASEFGVNVSRHDGLQSHCRDCKRAFQAEWYAKNKAQHISKVNKNRKLRVYALRLKLRDYLLKHPCVDCGESDTLMLDFDHVRSEKRSDISGMICSCFSWATILEEIAKCEVRCVKCHRRKTATQFRWNL